MQVLRDDSQKWQALRGGRSRQIEEQEQAKRYRVREMLPLPRRAVPRLSEDLASVIVRTAQAMGYPQPGWILRPEKAGHTIDSEELALLQRPLDYEMLVRLLDVDEATLHCLTLHHFATRVQGTSAVWSTETSGEQQAVQLSGLPRLGNPRQLFSYAGQTVQVCPHCLDEPSGYHRLYWRATPVLLCPRHSVWLLNSCAACQKPIPGLRPRLCTCPTCGGDYWQRVLPPGPEASWFRSTHCEFLTHLGIDAAELGEPSPAEEPSPLIGLASHEYFWMVMQFLEHFYTRSYRERLVPLLLHALPVEDLAPPHIQGALLLLHYLLACWPVHFWIMLERLQQAIEDDPLWLHSSYAPARQWETQLARGAIWDQGTSSEQTLAFLHTFFDLAQDYFQPHRHSDQSDASLSKNIVSIPLKVASQLRPPTQEEKMAPLPWEDLSSILGRVARAMHYEHPDWVLISTDTPHRKVYSREIPLLHRLADYQALEHMLGLDEAEVYHMTLHRFATRLQSPQKAGKVASSSAGAQSVGRPLLSRSAVRRVGISLRTTKICPSCLEEEPGYDRLFWRLRPVILCPRHSLVLIDRCPNCLAPVPGLRPSPKRCPYCRREYRQSYHALIAPTSCLYEGQILLLHLLTAQSASDLTGSPMFVASPILRVEPWQYFALLERFENFLQPGLTSSIVVQTLKKLAWEDDQSISESPAIGGAAVQIALFHYLLACWPDNFLKMIDRITKQMERQKVRESMGVNFWQADQLVPHIWSSSTHSDAPFAFLLQVFEALFMWATISRRSSSGGKGYAHE
jgi:TniQ